MANFSKSFNFRNGVQVDNDKFIVKPTTGLVGIGSTVPTQVLDVVGNIKATGTLDSNNVEVGTGITVGTASSNRIMLDIDPLTGVSSITAQRFYGDGSNMSGIFAISVAGFVANNTNGGILTSFRKVGIGVTTPTNRFEVEGDSKFTGVTTFVGVSTADNLFADAFSVSGNSNLDGNLNVGSANVRGVSTFGGAVDINAGLDVDGQADLDEVIVAGVSTFSALVDVNNRLDVVGGANIDQTNVSGVSTFGGAIDANAGADISGGETVLSSATVSDLTDNRIVIAGTSGALEDSGNLTFTGTQFTVTGNAAINGNLQVANGAIDANAGATLNQLNVTGVSTLTGRLTATEINSASSNVVRLLQDGVQVFNTIGAGVSVSNTLKIGSLNGGTSGLSALSGLLRYGNESASAPYSTRRSLDLINNDSGNINFYLNANNLSVPVDGSNFIWHKGFNNDRLMTLTNTGNLGIGETQPNTALHVNGISTVTGNSFVAGNFFGKQNLEIGGDAVITGDLSVTGNFSLNTTLNANVVGDVTGDLTGNVVATGNTSRFQKVGIKTDIANIIPSADLDVTNGDAVFKNVGIGSNQPDGILDVSGSLSNATKKFILLPKVSAAGTSVLQSNSVEGGALIYNTTLRKLQFYNGDNWETVTSVEA